MSPKITSTITYRKPGTAPPIFLAGSFSDPQWELQEMEYTTGEDGEHTFRSKVTVEAHQDYQFKLRIGHGDWWVLAENYPTGELHRIHHNNLLNVPEPSTEEQIAPAGPNTPAINVKHDTQPAPTSQEADNTKDESDDIKMPLFAHECLGAYDFGEGDSDHEAVPSASDSPEQPSKHKLKKDDMADIDINDPTLEKFPSDRGSILDALRTIQTHLGEDHTHLDDIPSSPRVVSSRRTSLDSADELSLSPAPLSPTTTRRRESRLSHSSFGRTRSAVSLGSIAEEPKPPGGRKPQSPPVVSLPGLKNPKGADAGFKSPPSEEDEAVVLKTSEVKPKEKNESESVSQVESYEAQNGHSDTGLSIAAAGGTSPAASAQEVEGPSDKAVEDEPPTTSKPTFDLPSQDEPDASASEKGKAPNGTSPAGEPPRSSRGSVLPMIVTTGALAVAIGIGWWQTSD
ncbi:hypothetical protein CEP51_016207 [Fusarium floridanum]|uniref:AMP-activated protein kinase glycogen-binding domain-containing protein n=1 Tax=Fusarium floridanum TaxID=1325733 RepID=A0A428NUV2_9HYPO|nr:hypothetical protein CEP51_016207 [Fusarium floridanum]